MANSVDGNQSVQAQCKIFYLTKLASANDSTLTITIFYVFIKDHAVETFLLYKIASANDSTLTITIVYVFIKDHAVEAFLFNKSSLS